MTTFILHGIEKERKLDEKKGESSMVKLAGCLVTEEAKSRVEACQEMGLYCSAFRWESTTRVTARD